MIRSLQPTFGKIILHDVSAKHPDSSSGSDSFDVTLTDRDRTLKPEVTVTDRYTLSKLRPGLFEDTSDILPAVARIFRHFADSNYPLKDEHSQGETIQQELPDHFRVILHSPFDSAAEIRWQEGGHGNFELEAAATPAALRPLITAMVKGKRKSPDTDIVEQLQKADQVRDGDWIKDVIDGMARFSGLTYPVLERNAEQRKLYPQYFRDITDVLERFQDWTSRKLFQKTPQPTPPQGSRRRRPWRIPCTRRHQGELVRS